MYKLKQKSILRLHFLLMKVLGMVNLADMRILELISEAGTYNSIEKVIKKLQAIYLAKSTPNIVIDLLGTQILRELEVIGMGKESLSKQVNLLTYLKLFTREELQRRI